MLFIDYMKAWLKRIKASDEVKALLKAVQGTKLEIPVMIERFYGFKRSEITGLKRSAIDFENKTITINHIITQSNGKLIIKDRTKTKSSKITLPLEPIVKSFLFEQEKIRNYVTETFLKLLKKKKLKIIRFHDLGDI